MTTRVCHFDIHVDSRHTGTINAAECVVLEEGGFVRRVDFRYLPEFALHPHGFALEPQRLPLGLGETRFNCQGGMPGFIDDHLPDSWGTKVLTALALHRDGVRLNRNSAIDLLTLLGGTSSIGALSFVPLDQGSPSPPPGFANVGASIDQLAVAERAATRIDAVDWSQGTDSIGLAKLAHDGSSIGGARPKALITDGSNHYLAKFNRLSGDGYNNARVELACLNMARAAGLEVTDGKVVAGVNGREALLLRRFDIDAHRHRRHLVTLNALLKEPTTERDSGLRFRYDDVADVLRSHSVSVQADLAQLARLALFNRAINNTDDHARNFSLIHDGDGYRLAPAYDLVPNLAFGEYHAASFGHQPWPPQPSEMARVGRIFSLPKAVSQSCASEVRAAVERWPEFAEQAGIAEEECERIGARFHP
ncbi:MAG: type II toxin-antitoxin system HipA family toxin [Gammaproteobacteria bacterium]|nr:type II toxin-antitoxin system HipA family toxin [Gammaproteobacteria bacterium]